ncbi:MAG: Uma2 family endonuclease, partial [Candidatus Bipolaricaulia bacterium]
AKIEIPTKRLTYEEFLAWCDEDTWAEWVDGEVIVLTPASDKHQDLVRFLVQVLGIYVEMKDLGVVRPAPFQMKTGPELPGREPDILFIAKEHLDRLKETHLDGPADLVIEIVSSESRLRDRGEKFAEYEIGGVQEYWLIDPEERRADFYRLGEDGRYRIVDLEPEGIYRSQIIPDFWLRVEWLWQEPLPPVLDVLRELELI